MSRLTRDGTAEPISRDQILRHARGQGDVHFPCSADHEQDWQPYPVDPYSAICDDHTYIHTYIQKHKQKKRKRGKNNRRENLPRSDRRGGEKMKQEQKNKSKDPPRISERQLDKQARQTKCQDHTTVDTVRESLSTPHQSLGGGQRTVKR